MRITVTKNSINKAIIGTYTLTASNKIFSITHTYQGWDRRKALNDFRRETKRSYKAALRAE
jgi:hypothetical protein